jgi:hypothetical protein
MARKNFFQAVFFIPSRIGEPGWRELDPHG